MEFALKFEFEFELFFGFDHLNFVPLSFGYTFVQRCYARRCMPCTKYIVNFMDVQVSNRSNAHCVVIHSKGVRPQQHAANSLEALQLFGLARFRELRQNVLLNL